MHKNLSFNTELNHDFYPAQLFTELITFINHLKFHNLEFKLNDLTEFDFQTFHDVFNQHDQYMDHILNQVKNSPFNFDSASNLLTDTLRKIVGHDDLPMPIMLFYQYCLQNIEYCQQLTDMENVVTMLKIMNENLDLSFDGLEKCCLISDVSYIFLSNKTKSSSLFKTANLVITILFALEHFFEKKCSQLKLNDDGLLFHYYNELINVLNGNVGSTIPSPRPMEHVNSAHSISIFDEPLVSNENKEISQIRQIIDLFSLKPLGIVSKLFPDTIHSADSDLRFYRAHVLFCSYISRVIQRHQLQFQILNETFSSPKLNEFYKNIQKEIELFKTSLIRVPNEPDVDILLFSFDIYKSYIHKLYEPNYDRFLAWVLFSFEYFLTKNFISSGDHDDISKNIREISDELWQIIQFSQSPSLSPRPPSPIRTPVSFSEHKASRKLSTPSPEDKRSGTPLPDRKHFFVELIAKFEEIKNEISYPPLIVNFFTFAHYICVTNAETLGLFVIASNGQISYQNDNRNQDRMRYFFFKIEKELDFLSEHSIDVEQRLEINKTIDRQAIPFLHEKYLIHIESRKDKLTFWWWSKLKTSVLFKKNIFKQFHDLNHGELKLLKIHHFGITDLEFWYLRSADLFGSENHKDKFEFKKSIEIMKKIILSLQEDAGFMAGPVLIDDVNDGYFEKDSVLVFLIANSGHHQYPIGFCCGDSGTMKDPRFSAGGIYVHRLYQGVGSIGNYLAGITTKLILKDLAIFETSSQTSMIRFDSRSADPRVIPKMFNGTRLLYNTAQFSNSVDMMDWRPHYDKVSTIPNGLYYDIFKSLQLIQPKIREKFLPFYELVAPLNINAKARLYFLFKKLVSGSLFIEKDHASWEYLVNELETLITAHTDLYNSHFFLELKYIFKFINEIHI